MKILVTNCFVTDGSEEQQFQVVDSKGLVGAVLILNYNI